MKSGFVYVAYSSDQTCLCLFLGTAPFSAPTLAPHLDWFLSRVVCLYHQRRLSLSPFRKQCLHSAAYFVDVRTRNCGSTAADCPCRFRQRSLFCEVSRVTSEEKAVGVLRGPHSAGSSTASATHREAGTGTNADSQAAGDRSRSYSYISPIVSRDHVQSDAHSRPYTKIGRITIVIRPFE